MNKKAQQNEKGLAILIIAFVVIGILVLYFLFKMLFAVGIAVLFISVILLIFGFASEEETLIIIGIIGVVIGIILMIVGHAGVSFFESNPTGKNLLDGANMVVNTSKDIGQDYAEITNSVSSAIPKT